MAKPDFSILNKAKPPEPTPEPVTGPEKPEWQKGARPSTMWFNIEQMHRLKEIGYRDQESVRDLLFEAINLLLPEKGELAVDRDNPRNRGYEPPAKKDR